MFSRKTKASDILESAAPPATLSGSPFSSLAERRSVLGLFGLAKQVTLLLDINLEKSFDLRKEFYLELGNWATSEIRDLHFLL